MQFDHSIRAIFAEVFGTAVAVQSISAVNGGCINDARKVTLRDGSCYFIKSNRPEYRSMFEAEETGLRVLGATNTFKTPRPVQSGSNSNQAYLILEWIEPGVKKKGFSQTLGQQLANLHRHRAQDRFGFQANNYLGSTQQLNPWSDDWVEFFMVKRLKYQLELAVQNGFSLLSRSGERVLQNIRSQINREARPSLIHGDLWSGNYIVGLNHEPYLIDPAPYWADREAEFGILTMFGGFDSDFFSAYQECYPLDSGFEDRLPIYQLYHYLNHLNLFGASYWGACQKILKHYS